LTITSIRYSLEFWEIRTKMLSKDCKVTLHLEDQVFFLPLMHVCSEEVLVGFVDRDMRFRLY